MAALTCALAGTVGAAAAKQDSPDPRPSGLKAFETAVLGTEHAAEHASMRRALRSAAEKQDSGDATAKSAETSGAPAPPPEEVGAWTRGPFTLPNYGIHAALLPTGKVMFFGYEKGDPDSQGLAALWDPALGYRDAAFTIVPPPEVDMDGDGDTENAPIFCAGQSFLPDGKLLIVGGLLRDYNQTNNMPAGHNLVFTFDPWTEQWTQEPSTEDGRYYPSQVLLADGRTVILSGYTEDAPGGVDNPDLELFVPDDDDGDQLGEIERVPSGDRATEYYPHLFTMPDGDVLLAGTAAADSAILSTDDFTWTELPPLALNRTGGAAVLRPGTADGSWRVTEIGGLDPAAETEAGDNVAFASTETIDLSQPDPEWQADVPLNLARARTNVVLLPDRSMVAVGGGSGSSEADGLYAGTEAHKQVELYDPGTGGWTVGPAQQELRTYHSTAMLLPDGRVFSTGDNYNPLRTNGRPYATDTAEIYSPPYLFAGPRPRITRAPGAIAHAERFMVRTKDGAGARAVLIAPAATTHAVDMNQRLVPLQVRRVIEGRGLRLAAPPTPEVAPPGWYMLFVLEQGVPSKAVWVHVG